MKPFLFVFHLFVIAPAILGQTLGLPFPDASTPAGWEDQSPGQIIGYLMLLGAVGLVLAIEGYKLLDKHILRELLQEPGAGETKRPDRREG